jgi:type III secretory pathway component EscU
MLEKTEGPRPKRIRDVGNKGNIAKNQDIISIMTLIRVSCYVAMVWDKHIDLLLELILIPTKFIGHCEIGDSAGHMLWGILAKMDGIIFPLVFMIALMRSIANFA